MECMSHTCTSSSGSTPTSTTDTTNLYVRKLQLTNSSSSANDNLLKIINFDMKNISRGCAVRLWKNECAAQLFLTPYNASEWDIFHIKNNQLIILFIKYLINIIIFHFTINTIYRCLVKKKVVPKLQQEVKWKLILSLVMISKFITLENSMISLLGT